MAKYKKGVVINKRTPIHVINITKNISESSSIPETEDQKKARIERNNKRVLRRTKSAQLKSHNSPKFDESSYDVIAWYHQLNYADIQNALNLLQIKPAKINNNYLLLSKIGKDVIEDVKQALLQCHHKTKSGKEYKVRVQIYKSLKKIELQKDSKKPSNNNITVATNAKNCRKTNKQNNFTSRTAHTNGRKTNKISHMPGTLDTSSIMRKILVRARKACAYLERKEKEVLRSSQPSKKNNKVVQQVIKF